MFEKRLVGAIDGPDPKLIEKTSALAADAFLALYGPEKTTKSKSKAKK